ncbi:MAG: hypothetical protein GY716_15630 [bacterium]|nr:hypothetical protein [bacterium]
MKCLAMMLLATIVPSLALAADPPSEPRVLSTDEQVAGRRSLEEARSRNRVGPGPGSRPERGASEPEAYFPDGVASGEVTATSALLWTRVTSRLPQRVEVSTEPDFDGRRAFKAIVRPGAKDDYTVRTTATGLAPETTYYFRWRSGPVISPVGSFRTAPAPDSAADVRFVYTGDSDGAQFPLFGNAFDVLDGVRFEQPDFWIYLGDTVYSDSSLRTALGLSPAAVTLDEYRETYRMNRAIPALPELMRSTSTFAIWDDHEVHNDYDGQTVDPARYANGRQAFLEHMPLLDSGLLEDETCVGDPLFSVFHWGSELDLIVLDERSCRSADAESACVTGVLDGQTFVDLAPTLPPILRAEVRSVLASLGVPQETSDLILPAEALPECLEAINDPSRTMLGPVQRSAFKEALATSQATFKVVVNQVPMQQIYGLPYDRWEAYAAERADLLNFIADNDITNVVFATTDIHANVINEVYLDASPLFFGVEPPAIAMEVITGPIATFSFEEEISETAKEMGFPGILVVTVFDVILQVLGADCRNLDTDAYALVEIDASAETATFSLKDALGNQLTSADGDDGCRLVLGPDAGSPEARGAAAQSRRGQSSGVISVTRP